MATATATAEAAASKHVHMQTLEGRSMRSAICGAGASAILPHGLPVESGVEGDDEGDEEAQQILKLAAAAITQATCSRSRTSAQCTPLRLIIAVMYF